MRRKLAWFAGLVAMFGGVCIGQSPADAAGTGDPVIVAPAPGATVANAFTGPITVDFSNAPIDTYDVSLECTFTYRSHTFHYVGDGDDEQTWFMTTPINTSQSCTLSVFGRYDTGSTESTFLIAPPPLPPLVVDSSWVSPATFYPLVHDDYRDTTTMHYRLSRSATVVARVLNSTGHRIRYVSLGTRGQGRHTWTWGGGRDDGQKVAPGNFRIRITAHAGTTRSVTETVTVATGWRTGAGYRGKYGWYTSSTSHSDYCGVDFDSYFATVQLTCFYGGAYAQAKYNFAIPSNAYNVRWTVYGDVVAGDKTLRSASGRRIDSTHYRITASVTDDCSWVIEEVDLAYSYKYRI
jgi:hypothetical protein